MEMVLNNGFSEMNQMEAEDINGGEIKWYDALINAIVPGYVGIKMLADDLNACYTNSYNDVIMNVKKSVEV